MTDTAATIGYGATFKLGNAASPSVLTEIGEVTSISLPNPQSDTHEATHFKSPDKAKEYISGLTDYGEITIGINYVAGGTSDLLISAARNQKRSVEIDIPTTASTTGWKFTFNAIVTGYAKDVPLNDRQTATVTLRVAGAVTEAVGA